MPKGQRHTWTAEELEKVAAWVRNLADGAGHLVTSSDGVALGQAIMDDNSPTLHCNLTLDGDCSGATAQETAEDAYRQAFDFLKTQRFELDISSNVDEKGKITSHFWARTV